MNDKQFELDRTDPAYGGQAVYTHQMLRAYDTLVVRLSNSLVWRCPASRILQQYNRFVTTDHLDVGPGTGYYLDRCRWPEAGPRITLLDPNPEVLRFSSDRLRRFGPDLLSADALKPIGLRPASFRSVGLSYVLHCMPGNIDSKAIVFDNLIPLVRPGGIIFGTTILNRDVPHTRVGRSLIGIYNRKGIFTNLDDGLEDLENALARRFERYELDVTGSVAFFAGWPEESTED